MSEEGRPATWADLVYGTGYPDRPAGREHHRLRDDPYPDEVDQEFCEDCETLCMDGRPCECCWVEMLDAAGP